MGFFCSFFLSMCTCSGHRVRLVKCFVDLSVSGGACQWIGAWGFWLSGRLAVGIRAVSPSADFFFVDFLFPRNGDREHRHVPFLRSGRQVDPSLLLIRRGRPQPDPVACGCFLCDLWLSRQGRSVFLIRHSFNLPSHHRNKSSGSRSNVGGNRGPIKEKEWYAGLFSFFICEGGVRDVRYRKRLQPETLCHPFHAHVPPKLLHRRVSQTRAGAGAGATAAAAAAAGRRSVPTTTCLASTGAPRQPTSRPLTCAWQSSSTRTGPPLIAVVTAMLCRGSWQ